MVHGLAQRAVGWLDRLCPPADGAPLETQRRSRLIVASIVVGSAVLIGSALSSVALGLDGRLVFYQLVWSAALLSLLLLLRAGASTSFVSNAAVGLVFTILFALSALSGGQNIGALFAFSTLPLLSMLLAGWRSCLAFTALSSIAILSSPWMPIDVLAPIHPLYGKVPGELVRDAMNVTLTVGLFSALYDAVRSMSLREAESARDAARRSETNALAISERQSGLLALVQRLQDASVETFDAGVEEAMEVAARMGGANRTVLRLVGGGKLIAEYTWSDDGNPSQLPSLDIKEAARTYSWNARVIAEGRVTQARHLDDLPEDAAPERAYLEQRGVKSWLCVPVRIGSQTLGYQSLECTGEHRTWTDDDVEILRLMTEILAGAIVRNHAERALRESEEQFAVAFHDHPDAMIISDLETDEVIACNDQWLREVAAQSRGDVVGRSLWDFGFRFPEDQKAAMRQSLREAGHTPPVETQIVGREQDLRTYLLSSAKIELNGRPCVLATAHDLTDRKQLEEQLMHSQKMEAVGRLAGGVAHDFNNMLTVIMGYSESLIERLDGEAREDAVEIREAARRSAHLTRQLLAFSRRQVLRTEVLDPNDVVRNMNTMLGPLIGEAIALRLALADTLGLVRADKGQLEQAIVNLVVNARDAMPDGGEVVISSARVEVGAEPILIPTPTELEPGEYILLTVEDDGEGMPADVAAHVMEPFFTTKREGYGTGLGLPIVHGFARQCGGALALESEPGRGTRVAIFLPVSEKAASTIGHDAVHRQKAARELEGRYTALLVEDERLLRRLTERTLTRAGFDVVTAENGPEGLARALELGDTLDLLVSDVVMPKLSGIELCQRVRETRPNLPVILMSGYPKPASGERELPEDVFFLQKPFDEHTLRQAAANAVDTVEDAEA